MAEDKKKTNENKADDKAKALETAMTQIEKQFGKGAIMRLGENTGMNVECIKTGSIALDRALGIGGVPREELSRYTVPNPRVKLPLLCMLLHRRKRRAALPRSLMLSTLLILYTLQI